MENKRLLELKKFPLIISIIFGIIFYIILSQYFNPDIEIDSITQKDFFIKYTMYSPVLFGFLSLIFFYILLLIKFILRLNFFIVTIFLYLISFGFFLILGIDLLYFEPKYADFMLALINTFSIPLIYSSSIIMILVVLLSFKKPKSIKG